MNHTVSVDHVFEALADPRRRQILEQLGTHGISSASALAQNADISRQAIAKHLKILEAAGLVHRRRNGREICFGVDVNQLSATGRWMQRVATRWSSESDLAELPQH